MDLIEAIATRRTIRAFDRRPIPRLVLERIMHAAIMAPNPLNAQSWRFEVIAGSQRDELVRVISQFPTYMADLLRSYPQDVRQAILEFARDLGGAPVIVVISVPALTSSRIQKVDLIAASTALQNLQLAAWAEGVGSVCLTNALWVESEIGRALQLGHREIVTVVPMGYPAFLPEPPPRRDDVIHWLGFE